MLLGAGARPNHYPTNDHGPGHEILPMTQFGIDHGEHYQPDNKDCDGGSDFSENAHAEILWILTR
jgi:hypothetical protein